MKRLLRPIKPLFAVQVEQVVGPTYARTDAVATSIADLRSALGTHVDATTEAVVILGQRINALEQRLAALEEALGASARGVPGPAATPTSSSSAPG